MLGIISKKQNDATGNRRYLIFVPLVNANLYSSITINNIVIQGIVVLSDVATDIRVKGKTKQGISMSFESSSDYSGLFADCTFTATT